MTSTPPWIREMRAPFVLLILGTSLAAVAMAAYDGYYDWPVAVSCILGLLAIHASVNIFNDYFDFESGIDVVTKPTPFSGGSRMLPEGLMTRRQVLAEGIVILCVGLGFGFYVLFLTNFSIPLILLILFAVACSIGYSPLFANKGIGELMAFLGLGPAPTIGTYLAITGMLNWSPILLGTIAGAMGSSVLYVNEFPDFEADREKGRMNLVVRIGKAKASKYLKYYFILGYIAACALILLRMAPITMALTFLTIPWTTEAFRVLESHYDNVSEHLPSNALTIKAAVSTGYLLAGGFAISLLLSFVLQPV